MNKHTGVLGVYNCQGAAWNSIERKNTFHQTNSDSITGYIRGRDVHLISEIAVGPEWNGDCAVYTHNSGELITLPYNVAMPVSLKVLEHEIYTVTPIKTLAPGFSFAPLGLVDMYNAGGAIEGLKYEAKAGAQLAGLEKEYEGERAENLSNEVVAVVSIQVKGCGRFGAYSSAKPRKCKIGSSLVDFAYDSATGLVTLDLADMPAEEQKVHLIEVEI
jgi:raffinose synthase